MRDSNQYVYSGSTNAEKMRKYAQPPFAVNGTYVSRATIKNVYSLKTRILVRKYGVGTSRPFTIFNEHPAFNIKFKSTNPNPYDNTEITEERKNHIKIRHSLILFNANQFVKTYTAKFADITNNIESILTKKEASEAYKSSCWKTDDIKTNETEIFNKIREIAEMTDVNDFFKKDPKYFIIYGKRKIAGKEQIIDVLLEKNYSFGSAFPDDMSVEAWLLDVKKDSLGRPIDEVKKEILKLTELDLEKAFNDYISTGDKPLGSISYSLKAKSDEFGKKQGIKVRGGKKIYVDSINSVYKYPLQTTGLEKRL